VDYLDCPSFLDIFQAVLSNKTSFGILPIENSTTGRVHQALHLFFDTSTKICGETYLRVSHCLLIEDAHALLLKGFKYKKDAAGNKNKKPVVLDKIYSHPQVFEQCAQYLRERYPNASLVSVSSSSRAAEIVSAMAGEDQNGESHSADIIRVHAALGSMLCVCGTVP